MLWKLPFKACWFCQNQSGYFFLWIEWLVHIVQGNFWINPCYSVVDHWSKGWPYTPYILMRQSSGQNMHGQWLRDPVTFMPRRCQRPERKLALHRFLHTLLSKKSNNFSERLLYSWLSNNLFLCVLEGGAGEGGRSGAGGLLHRSINLDSTSIIITGHKIVASFFLRRFLLSVSILGAIFMHTSIFSAWGEGAVEYFEFGVYPRVTNTYMYMCQRYPVYIHVREFLATKGITWCFTMSGQRSGFTNAYNRPCRLTQTNSYNSCSIDFFSACLTSVLSD